VITAELRLAKRLAGGTKVIRCEISLDDGVTWRLADISRFEEPNWAGKHWCWVHFSLEVPIGASSPLQCLNTSDVQMGLF